MKLIPGLLLTLEASKNLSSSNAQTCNDVIQYYICSKIPKMLEMMNCLEIPKPVPLKTSKPTMKFIYE